MKREELIKKTIDYVESLPKIHFKEEEVDFCKSIHNQRTLYRKEWNDAHPYDYVKDNKISRWHTDDKLWWGLLGELMVCNFVDESKNLLKKWALDQIRQNEQLKNRGHFDSTDIGHTQVRTAEYTRVEPRRLIYRPGDFRSKSNQPVIGCVINTDESNLWGVICGFMSWDDLKNRREEFWDDPDKRGYSAMWIPYWELTPMKEFKQHWLT